MPSGWQRDLDRRNLPTRVLPSANGMRLALTDGRLTGHHIDIATDAGAAVADHLHRTPVRRQTDHG
ncbi:hypothetical protein [Actinomadura sp. 6N118]|uniref:hypothetical protein n=1 Tax=Actinomadura sp. 6N118 TaxID=3375151 RepID=UPI00379545A7